MLRMAYRIKKELMAFKPLANQPQYVPSLHFAKTKTYEVILHINLDSDKSVRGVEVDFISNIE